MNHPTMFALTTAAACSIAGAQEMIPLSQERGIATGGFLDQCFNDLGQSVLAKNFDPFDQTILLDEECDQTRTSILLIASQNSTINPRTLSVHNDTQASLIQNIQGTNLGIASSSYEVVFELTERSDFLISGGIVADAHGSGNAFWGAHAQLFGLDSGEVLTLNFSSNGDGLGIEETFSHFGEIPAGRYRLTTSVGSILDAPGELGEILVANTFGLRLHLLSECRADINADGVLDADDFFGFLDLFAAGDPLADITGDGSIDADDFFAYLDLFAAGCD